MKKILGILAALLCVHAAFAIEIEAALAETADQFSKTLQAGSTIAIIGISSDTEEMSDFMLDELTVNFVKLRKLKVADRANLAAIKKEMNFQLSGEVGDDSIQQIGAMAGAQTVIRGNMKQIGDTYLLVIHALNVTTAAVEDIYRKKIEPNEMTALLMDTQSGGKKTKKHAAGYGRYSGGQQFGIGVGNWFFGTGSYVTGHFIDGAVLSAWHITNIGLILGGVAAMGSGGSWEKRFGTMVTMETLGSLSSIGAIMYGFIRPKFYTKRPSMAAGAADVLSGFNLAFVPLENGSVAPCLAYSISF